jgi:Tfp pilus assembly protein PilV
VSRRATRPRAAAAVRRGFTIIETMVAIMMIVVGVLALVGVSTIVSRQMTSTRQLTLATAMGRARLERLQGISCASLAAGTASERGIRERWSVTTPAPGLNAAADVRVLRDSVFVTDAGRTHVQVYVSMRSCA